nr:MAG TPA: hypothetical protein [Caudoviricetes sp.]
MENGQRNGIGRGRRCNYVLSSPSRKRENNDSCKTRYQGN